jgi:benzoate-CoA ligase family protein
VTDGGPIRFPDLFNLADYFLFDRLRDGLGEKVAIRWGERAYTYAQVADRARDLARALPSLGVERGARVYVVLPDAPPFAWAFFGTLAAGAVVTMGNPDAPLDDLIGVVEYVRPSALITIPRIASALLARAPAPLPLRRVLLVPEVATGDDPEKPLPIDLPHPDGALRPLTEALAIGRLDASPLPALHRDDQAIWLFTSGSTGRPKAAMHTHRDFAFNCEAYAKRTVGYCPSDTTVSVPRLYFGYATGTNLMFPFAVGATVGLYAERPTPETLAGAIAAYRPTIVTNVPTMMGKLLEHDEQLAREGRPRLDLSSVRFHLSAGEALPPPLLERFTARFRNDVYDGIGSAEMFHIYASNRPGDIKPGSLGKAVEGYTIRILPDDAAGPGTPALAPGEIGVMWVRGDSVALGYHQDRDKSWATFAGHWCRTGDLFRVDAEGYLWFSGRADDLIKVSGLWVAPVEVEACLMDHPSVALAAVVGAEEDGLTKPKAYVVVREGERGRLSTEAGREALSAALREHVKERLAKHKYPRWIEFVDDLPKNDRGKVDRRSLKERARHG